MGPTAPHDLAQLSTRENLARNGRPVRGQSDSAADNASRSESRASYSALPMIAPAQPMARTAAMSFFDVIPAEAMMPTLVECDRVAEQVEVRALQQAVPVDRGDLERGNSLVGKQRDSVQCVQPGRRGDPAAADGLTITDIDCDCHPFGAVLFDQGTGERRVTEGGCAHNRACGA